MHLIPTVMFDRPSAVSQPRTVQAACSANMIIDARLFEEVGAFDEDLSLAIPISIFVCA